MSNIDNLIAAINDGVEDYLKKTAEELTQKVRNKSQYLNEVCSSEVTYANFLEMAKAAKPVCEVIESGEPDLEGQRKFVFRITSPAEASLLGIIIGGDTNAELHMGQNGTTQSNALIGICTYAVMRSLGGVLIIVDPLNFAKALPLEVPTTVTIVIPKQKGRVKIFGTIEVSCDQAEQTIMKVAKLTMYVDPKR